MRPRVLDGELVEAFARDGVVAELGTGVMDHPLFPIVWPLPAEA
jgi:hypothetical protein